VSDTAFEPDVADVSVDRLMHALSDPVRLEIVRMAAAMPEQPCNCFFEKIPKSTLSHHWKVLREAGLIRQVRRGTQKLNSLRRVELDKRFPGLIKAVLSAIEPRQIHKKPASRSK
jgi:DNA-binding transcriptional ArsR family regulator